MPPWLQAVILGVVQGLTEFVPVSSSGHLVIVPYLAGWPDPGLAFDVALHVGTFFAVLAYFRRELVAMARGLVFGGRDPDGRLYRKLGLFVIAASVPVGIGGLLLEDLVSEATEEPLVVAGFLVVTAGILLLAEHARNLRVSRQVAAAPVPNDEARVWTGSWVGEQGEEAQSDVGMLPVGDDGEDPLGTSLDEMTLRQALAGGLIQLAALLPGVSRSGSTISGGMMAGMTREAATRFSFLLSLPALFGAFVLSLPDLTKPGPYSRAAIVGGVVASFVAGYAAVRFLINLVARDRLTGFARYCLFVAVVTLIAYQFLGPPSSV